VSAPLPSLKLYHYWRSSSSWRVRWALELKRVSCEFVAINLLTDEVESPEHQARNPLAYVPTLELVERDAGPLRHLSESMAIIEWLDEMKPDPGLLPSGPLLRARARQLAEMINSGTQPLQNPTVAQFHSLDPAAQKTWNVHWIRKGLGAYERLVAETAGIFSIGDQVSLADLFLIPQCYAAGRNEIPLSDFPTIERIHAAALATQACQASHPDRYAPKT
jgi:maleylpyruvate isomerase